MTKTDLPPQALTIKQFCECYGVSRSFAYTQIAAGKLRTRKAGRRTLIMLFDANWWLNTLPSGQQSRDVRPRADKK